MVILVILGHLQVRVFSIKCFCKSVKGTKVLVVG